MTEIDQKVLEAGSPGLIDERACEVCGGPAFVWFAPNKLWNLVIGGPTAAYDPGGVLCPNCFIKKAELSGIVPTAWKIERGDDLPAVETLADTTSNAAETAKPVAWQHRYKNEGDERWSDWATHSFDPSNALSGPFEVRPLYAAPQPLSTSSGEDRAAIIEAARVADRYSGSLHNDARDAEETAIRKLSERPK